MTLNACAELVRKGDPDRFMAAMAAPPAARAKLFPIYAFNLEVAKAPWVTREPLIAQMRLQFWQDVVNDVVAGKEPRAHDVAGPFAQVMKEAAIPPSLVSTLITARYWDINGDIFANEEEVIAHIDRGAGSLTVMAGIALGAPEDQEEALREVAVASGIANWLVAVPAIEKAGRKPLAHATLAEVKNLADYGLRMLDKHKATDFGPAVPALRAGWQAKALLTKAKTDPQAVPEGRLNQSEFRKKASLLVKSLTNRW